MAVLTSYVNTAKGTTMTPDAAACLPWELIQAVIALHSNPLTLTN